MILMVLIAVISLVLIVPSGVAAESQAPDVILIDTNDPGQPGFYQGGDPNTPGPDVVVITPDGEGTVHP